MVDGSFQLGVNTLEGVVMMMRFDALQSTLLDEAYASALAKNE